MQAVQPQIEHKWLLVCIMGWDLILHDLLFLKSTGNCMRFLFTKAGTRECYLGANIGAVLLSNDSSRNYFGFFLSTCIFHTIKPIDLIEVVPINYFLFTFLLVPYTYFVIDFIKIVCLCSNFK